MTAKKKKEGLKADRLAFTDVTDSNNVTDDFY